MLNKFHLITSSVIEFQSVLILISKFVIIDFDKVSYWIALQNVNRLCLRFENEASEPK